MVTATLSLDLLLGDVRSLKQKRSLVRPLVAEIHRRFGPAVAVAEVGHHDLHRRAEVGVAVVAGDGAFCQQVLDAVERLVADRPEVQLLATRRRLHADAD